MASVQISYRQVDAPAQVVAIWNELNEALDPQLDERIAGDFEKYVEKISRHAVTIACWVDSALAGAISFYANDCVSGNAFITQLAVKPKLQGNHLGAGLLERSLNYCVAEGFSSVCLQVWKDRKSAIALYKKHGFNCIADDGQQATMELVLHERTDGCRDSR